MSGPLLTDIIGLAEAPSGSQGQPFRTLSVNHVQVLADRYGIAGRDVEIAALESEILPQRYSRNLKTVSLGQQARLLRSSALVVGLGGLGGVVVELMARMGVGALHVIDGDRFEESNLNRQVLCTGQTLGETKVSAAVDRIQSINPSIAVFSYDGFLTEKTGPAIIERADLVVDCLGGVTERLMLEKVTKEGGRPLISAAVAGLSGHVMTVFPEDRGLELIYGDPRDLSPAGAEAVLGCPPQGVTLLAACQCSEVAHVLLKQEGVLRNRMLAIDLDDFTFEIVVFP